MPQNNNPLVPVGGDGWQFVKGGKSFHPVVGFFGGNAGKKTVSGQSVRGAFRERRGGWY